MVNVLPHLERKEGKGKYIGTENGIRPQFGIVHQAAYAYDPARNAAQQKEGPLRGLGLTQRGREVETKIKTERVGVAMPMLFT